MMRILNSDNGGMIFPPALYSDARQEYDILDLEVLGRLAIEACVHTVPEVKKMFERLLDSVGTRRFAEDYCLLEKYVLKARTQPRMPSTDLIATVDSPQAKAKIRVDKIPVFKERQATFLAAMNAAADYGEKDKGTEVF